MKFVKVQRDLFADPRQQHSSITGHSALGADSISVAKRSAFINSIAARTMRSRVTGRRSARKDPLPPYSGY